MIISEFEELIHRHLETIDADTFIQLIITRRPTERLDNGLLRDIKKQLQEDWFVIIEDTPTIHIDTITYAPAYIGLINAFYQQQILNHNEVSELFSPYLEKQYNAINKNAPPLNDLLAILNSCARLLGCPLQNEDNYPLSRLDKLLTANDLIHNKNAILNRQSILTQMTLMHFVLHQYCMPQQRDIIFKAIWYRKNTTKEEQHAQTRLFEFLENNDNQCKQFFSQQSCYIDFKVIDDDPLVSKLKDFIPSNKEELINRVSFSESICLFLNVYSTTRHADPAYFKKEAGHFIAAAFDNQQSQSFQDLKSFAKNLFDESQRLEMTEQKIFQSALQVFCLQAYIKIRAQDNMNMFFSFSPATKISAARKMIQRLEGESIHLNVTENLALKEGRLSEILNVFATPSMEHEPRATI